MSVVETQFIAVTSDNNSRAIRVAKSSLRPLPEGWVSFEYGTENDILLSLNDNPQFTVLEIVAHGTPSECNGISEFKSNIDEFGAGIAGLVADTKVIYLSACNTGLREMRNQASIAQLLANHARCPVFGTKGYITGTHAQGNAKVTKTDGSGGSSYIDSADETIEKDCWNKFKPTPAIVNRRGRNVQLYAATLETMGAKIHLIDDPDNQVSELRASALYNVIHRAFSDLNNPPFLMPPLRMAPDARITFYLDDETVRFELLANKTLLREASSEEVRRFQNTTFIGELVSRYFAVPAHQ